MKRNLPKMLKTISALAFLVLGTVNCGPGFKINAVDGDISQVIGANDLENGGTGYNFGVVVLDGATGKPIPGAKVLAKADVETTDANGFANFGLWPAGWQPFDVSFAGYDTRSFPCLIDQDKVCTVNIYKTGPKPTPSPTAPAP